MIQHHDEESDSQPSQGQDVALVRLMTQTMRPHWRLLLLAFVLLLFISGLNVLPPFLVGKAVDEVQQTLALPADQRSSAGLWWLAAAYGGSALALFVLQYAQLVCIQLAGQRALAALRSRLFDHMLHQTQAFHGKYPVGDLVARLTSDIDALNALLSSSIVTILSESGTLIAIVVVMFAVNWRLALLALAVLPVLAVVTRYFRRRIRHSSGGERSALARISGYLSEHLVGMTLVQLFGRQAETARGFDEYNMRYRRALLMLRKHSALFLAVQEVLAAVGLAALLYGGGQGVLAGWATLGTLVAFVQYADRAFQPVLRLSEQYNAVQIALGAAERVQRMLEIPATITSPPAPVMLPRVHGTVELRNVCFSYVPDEPVLRDLSLTIPAGQSVAVVGATGAGKSSLAGLLARFYDPQQGQVLLDGTNIKRLALDDLRSAVAVVPQDPVCVAGSIAQNIRLYRDDLTDADIKQAAEWTNAARFIEQLPGGYDYQVLPGGANLSVGQRQLLALARALALSPEGVLVLDEATSSIDTATEALIQSALDRILHTRTSLVIAHRLSTVRNADRIIVMHRGQIVEDGNHASLLALGGYYARLHQHHAHSRTV